MLQKKGFFGVNHDKNAKYFGQPQANFAAAKFELNRVGKIVF
jgi:hypothetical protein